MLERFDDSSMAISTYHDTLSTFSGPEGVTQWPQTIPDVRRSAYYASSYGHNTGNLPGYKWQRQSGK